MANCFELPITRTFFDFPPGVVVIEKNAGKSLLNAMAFQNSDLSYSKMNNIKRELVVQR